jgi:hypothetical protein
MLITKLITTTVNIQDAINYSANAKSTLMSILIRKFTNKCYDGSYIIEVTKIIEKSACRVQKTNLSGEGYVDVTFEVLASVINVGDIVTNCVIHKIDTCITCESNTDGAAIVAIPLNNNIAKVVSVGQTLSVVVIAVKYDPFKSKITIIGNPIECDKQNIVYKVEGRMSAIEHSSITDLCKKIHELYENRKLVLAANNASIDRMEHAIYPYKNIIPSADVEWIKGLKGPTKYIATPDLDMENMLSLCTDPNYDYTGLWSRIPSLVKSSPFVNKDIKPDKSHVLVNSTPYNMALTTLNSIYKYAKYINETSVIYGKESEYKKHLNIWMSMKLNALS